ncbi:ATP-dependent DNA ligase [Jaminaea rosea]|uniref:DNA ligase n=1 Tax=Jaminaea rosea TaxID=1569628 RepID=A0A316V0I5_9BASI|nr:ATP-dependent DNA ligase [Jaminaea rosea]PWN31059.1 ATP-dependent DNA ligase [Jaminaea rosea]
MGKQSTLGNFVDYPPGAAKPPPQQGDLKTMFKKNKSTASTSASPADESAASSSKSVKDEAAQVDDDVAMKDASSSSRAASSSSSAPRKRSRIQISDSEEEEDVKPVVKKEQKINGSAKAAGASSSKSSGNAKASSSNSAVKKEKQDAPALTSEASPEAEDEGSDTASSEGEEEEEDKAEDPKAHVKVAAMFMKASERKAAAAGASSSNKSDAKWQKGKPIPYAALADVFSQIDKTTKRLEIQDILSTFLVTAIEHASTPEEVTQAIYLCINRLCPDYLGLELGLGESLIIKAIAQSTGRGVDKIKKDLEELGDLGRVAMASRAKQPTMFQSSALTVPGVFKTLKEIATTSGNKSQDKKIGLIMKLLSACKGEETKWIIRSIEGKLRIGLAEKTVMIALARSAVFTRFKTKNIDTLSDELKMAEEQCKAAFSEMPNYDILVPALIKDGPEGLRKTCHLTPGIPLKPMLARPTKAITEVLDRFEDRSFTCEYKYDGERAQIHFYVPGEANAIEGEQAAPTKEIAGSSSSNGASSSSSQGRLGVFSRNSEDMSVKYPDLLESIARCRKPETKSFVIDAEVTAWKAAVKNEAGEVIDAGGLQPFQQLSTRKRKDVQADKVTVKVKLFAFDILYLNGEPLLQYDLATRREKLRSAFNPNADEFDYATSQDCNTVEEIAAFLEASVQDRCEGLMVKMLQGKESTYEPSRRSQNWLKLKKDYLSGAGDSLDLVVLGGYYGKGKRTKVYGAFLLGCWDVDSESYQTVCKIGTGFTEANLEDFTAQLKPLELTVKKGYYDVGGATPDVYFEPKVVWEVRVADLSLSPIYTAAKGAIEARGISLRFPRFIRIRDDKDPEDSTGPEQIAEMYRKQASAQQGKKGGGGDDDYW